MDAKANRLGLSLGWVTFCVTDPTLKGSQVSYLGSLDEFQRVFYECLKIQCKYFLCESVYGFSLNFYQKNLCGIVDQRSTVGSRVHHLDLYSNPPLGCVTLNKLLNLSLLQYSQNCRNNLIGLLCGLNVRILWAYEAHNTVVGTQ